MHTARRGALIVAAAIVSACASGPQFARSERASATTPRLLLPGSRDLDVSLVRDEAVDYAVLADSGTEAETHAFGAGRMEIHAASYAGAPALLLVARSNRGTMHYSDSALVRRDDLTPVWEVSEFRGWRRRFDYDGARVRVVGASPDSTLRREHAYPQAVFGFNEVDLLVRTIPLVPGYHAIVPLYSEGSDELEMDTISVARTHPHGAWDVRFSDPVIVSHYEVDSATRTIVSRVITRQDGNPLRLRYEFETNSSRPGLGDAMPSKRAYRVRR